MSDGVAIYEKLGAFYLGRPYDVARGATDPAPLLYDSRDLLTHAVCVGMTGSGKTGLLIGLLEEAAIDFAIYTPGSEAGLQVSILSSLDAPPPEVIAEGDALRERIGTVVSSLLSLLDVESDSIQGREHILLASIFDAAWRAGQGLDL